MPGSSIPEQVLTRSTREFPVEVLLSASSGRRELRGGERALLAYVLPPWQRDDAWGEDRKRRFVEGIFLGLGTGYYVVHASDWDGQGAKPMSGWLLDGQQRLTALRDFVHGDLTIFDGVRYGDLDVRTVRKRFMRVVFPCIELPYMRDEQRLRELYERLNFGGVAHTEQDRERLMATPPAAARQRG